MSLNIINHTLLWQELHKVKVNWNLHELVKITGAEINDSTQRIHGLFQRKFEGLKPAEVLNCISGISDAQFDIFYKCTKREESSFTGIKTQI